MKTLIRALLILPIPLLVGVLDLGAQDTWINLVSDPGDNLGQGQTYHIVPPPGTLSVYAPFPNVIEVDYSYYLEEWQFTFTGAGGAVPTVGVYPNAQRFAGPNYPGLAVAADSRGCNTSTGSFEIKQLARGPDGTILSLWATLEDHCEGMAPALRGEIRFNTVAAEAIPTLSSYGVFALLVAVGVLGVLLLSGWRIP